MSEKSNPYGASDTGHVWDDNLRELTNQPPKWWMIGLHASWILVLVYSIAYPSWPMLSGATKGMMGWTSIGEYNADVKALDTETKRGKYEEKLSKMSAAAILADADLKTYVQRSAKVLFGDNCAACHGGGGAGTKAANGDNFPVLNDDDWLYGGKIDEILTTINNGRQGMMPAMGGAQLTEAEVDELAGKIAAGQPTASPAFQKGACFACHGMDGKGMAAMGSANLTDKIWRFGDGSAASIKHTIQHGVNDPKDAKTRKAVMPKFGGTKLTETDIKKLAVYVHSLGGGK